MAVTIGALRESVPPQDTTSAAAPALRLAETRVALVPAIVDSLVKAGAKVLLQRGAGAAAQFPDAAYGTNVEWAGAADDILARADVLLTVQPLQAAQIAKLRRGALVIGFMQAHANAEAVRALRDGGITSFAMEFVPRISRAQSMDALSSQAAVAGYEAVLLAALHLDKFLPMLTTAAGTIRPAMVLVIGAGVAGLQAIATARRLGAVVEAYDVRSATREQIKSLGAKFVETGVSADGAGGYARELTAEEKQTQQEALDGRIAAADAVVSTAAIPGRAAPRIISRAAVERMKPGAVIVDIAAESGGNCELTQAGQIVIHQGVRIIGPVNLPAKLSQHASEMYSRNLFNLLKPALHDGQLAIDWQDEVFEKSCLTHDGAIRHEPTRQAVEGASS